VQVRHAWGPRGQFLGGEVVHKKKRHRHRNIHHGRQLRDYCPDTPGYIVKYNDWHYGFIFLGITFVLIGVSLSQLFMGRINPESYGLLPDGDRRTAKAPEADHVVKHPSHLLE
jgi:hypothetical protein